MHEKSRVMLLRREKTIIFNFGFYEIPARMKKKAADEHQR